VRTWACHTTIASTLHSLCTSTAFCEFGDAALSAFEVAVCMQCSSVVHSTARTVGSSSVTLAGHTAIVIRYGPHKHRSQSVAFKTIICQINILFANNFNRLNTNVCVRMSSRSTNTYLRTNGVRQIRRAQMNKLC
jgi:hypothetical protein